MRIDEFIVGLKTALEVATTKEWGVAEPPSDSPTLPYGVIHVIPGAGMMDGFEKMTWLNVNTQISCIGVTPQQCLWLRHKAMAALIGDSAELVSVGDESVSMVIMTSAGGLADSGHSLWVTEDNYRFTIPVA